MIYGYARVSISAQDLPTQRDRLKATTLGDAIIVPAVDRLSQDTGDLLIITRDLKQWMLG